MKGIIVVDMPETCLGCGFYCEIDEGTLACCTLAPDEKSMYGRRVIDADYCQDKPGWCPIKPVPKKFKKETALHGVYDIIHETSRMGWNACIDEIVGVEENE